MSSNPAPPMGGGAAMSSPDDDDDALEEGELRVPIPVVRGGHESSDSDTTEHDDHASEAVRRPLQLSPRLRASLGALDILLLGVGAGGALPSPTTPSSGECDSDATISDDDLHGRDLAVERGWAATGRRGCKAGGKNKNNRRAAVVFSDSDSDESGLNTVSAGDDVQAPGTTTSSIIPQPAAAALHHHHQPPPAPVPKQEAHQPPRAPQPPLPPRRKRERPTEYTCKECGKSYSTNQALGGHAAGHKNKQREAAAMVAAAAAAAGVEGRGASLDAAFPFPLHRGGGGKVNKTHECRQCGKVFGTGVALGGHMRVHYTGPPIVPARKNKKRCLAPPPTAAPPVGLSLGLSIKAEENVAAAPAPAVAATGLSLGLSVKAEEEPPSTLPAASGGGAVSVVRLFGIDISPQAQQAPLQQQQGSGDTTQDSSTTTGQEQH